MDMNERVMQFRIGMFVIVAGLVLSMLIVWFGESPSLFRDYMYVTAHFVEAPAIAENIPVRKSGIRIGEVASIRFDDRPRVSGVVKEIRKRALLVELGDNRGLGLLPTDQFIGTITPVGGKLDVVINHKDDSTGLFVLALPDGVLVTIALERKAMLRAGAAPRISRALIGDVSIDMSPGSGPGPLPTSADPMSAPIIEGTVAPDPSSALAAATEAFEKVGGTLESIDAAAKGIAVVAKRAEKIDEVIVSIRDMGTRVGTFAEDANRVIKANEADIQPAIANFRQFAENANKTLDEKTQANLRASINQLNSSTAKLDRVLTDLQPLAADLGETGGKLPKTTFGQTILRINGVAFDVGLLTRALRNPDGTLNPNGSLQKLILKSELYDNVNLAAGSVREAFSSTRPLIRSLSRFAERISNDPAALGRGVLQR
jgi:phospholipid/cholesterol/gamma-HCH transport system substrate-binding protein